ncbi:MAG: hypothetical protein M1274_11160, partial [Actinobacteria bacterium]|nr:hypothetical protein [Actinomycetota bacterium]
AGATATVTGYRAESVAAGGTTSSLWEVMDSGAAGNPITISGGWDTGSSTRTFYTFLRKRRLGAGGEQPAMVCSLQKLHLAGVSRLSPQRV